MPGSSEKLNKLEVVKTVPEKEKKKYLELISSKDNANFEAFVFTANEINKCEIQEGGNKEKKMEELIDKYKKLAKEVGVNISYKPFNKNQHE